MATTIRVNLSSLKVGPEEASGAEDGGMMLHLYFGKQTAEITDGAAHKIGIKINIDQIFRWHADGDLLHLQLATAPVELLEGQKT